MVRNGASLRITIRPHQLSLYLASQPNIVDSSTHGNPVQILFRVRFTSLSLLFCDFRHGSTAGHSDHKSADRQSDIRSRTKITSSSSSSSRGREKSKPTCKWNHHLQEGAEINTFSQRLSWALTQSSRTSSNSVRWSQSIVHGVVRRCHCVLGSHRLSRPHSTLVRHRIVKGRHLKRCHVQGQRQSSSVSEYQHQ